MLGFIIECNVNCGCHIVLKLDFNKGKYRNAHIRLRNLALRELEETITNSLSQIAIYVVFKFV